MKDVTGGGGDNGGGDNGGGGNGGSSGCGCKIRRLLPLSVCSLCFVLAI